MPGTQRQHLEPNANMSTLSVSLLGNLGLKEYICNYSIIMFLYFLLTHSLFQAMYKANEVPIPHTHRLQADLITSCKMPLQPTASGSLPSITVSVLSVGPGAVYTQIIEFIVSYCLLD